MPDQPDRTNQLAWGCSLPSQITSFINAPSVDHWQEELEKTSPNRFQEVTLLNFFEGIRTLIQRRDYIDDIREQILAQNKGNRTPTSSQQTRVYRVVSSYFDEYYTTLSKLSGVNSRFTGIFSKNFSENAPFLTWLGDRYSFPEPLQSTLTAARQFRALLAHPQQFPSYEWATAIDPGSGGLLRLSLWGPFGRGKNPIPPGAQDNSISAPNLPEGWNFVAPDEVDVTNSLATVGQHMLAEILVSHSDSSAFRRTLPFSSALERLASGGNTAEDHRRTPSRHEQTDLPPSSSPSDWISA